jgi:hypothetical protein
MIEGAFGNICPRNDTTSVLSCVHCVDRIVLNAYFSIGRHPCKSDSAPGASYNNIWGKEEIVKQVATKYG